MASPTKRGRKLNKRLEDICEYTLAKKRFKSLCDSADTEDDLDDSPESQYERAISKICNHIKLSKDEVRDMEFVFGLLAHADFIQIKDEELENFYDGVVKTFFNCGTDWIDDMKDNSDKLQIPHVRLLLAKALVKKLGFVVNEQNGDMIIVSKPEKKNENSKISNLEGYQSFRNLKRPKCVTLRSCKFKKTEEKLLNVILCLLNVDELQIGACHIPLPEIDSLISDLLLKKLILRDCCFQTEVFMRHNFSNFIENLKELHITYTIIEEELISLIRDIPLITLNLRNTYILKRVDVSKPDKYFELDMPNFEVLFQDCALRKSLKNLNISHDEVSDLILVTFWKPKVEVCTGIFEEKKPNSRIKVHVALQKNYILAQTFHAICNMKIEDLEIRYNETISTCFRLFKNRPLVKTLKRLTLHLSSISPSLLSFLASLELEYFNCEVNDTLFTFNLDSFLNDYPEERSHLKTLILTIRTSKHSLTKEFVRGLESLNLTKFSLLLKSGSEIFSDILNLENFQKSLEVLSLRDTPMDDSRLANLQKFEKLKVLEFDFDEKLNVKSLKSFLDNVDPAMDLKMRALTNPYLGYKIRELIDLASTHCKGFKSDALL